MTLLPPSYAACNRESVMFTCSATTQTSIRWTITSPMMNYQPLDLTQLDVGIMPLPTRGDFSFNVTSYTPSTMELETTVTVTASEDLNGTMLECATIISGDVIRRTAVMTVIGNFTFHNMRLPEG